jgi:D-3-phosphoglycerate dehydrogenase / 2-oxoglutarate reductase
VRVLVVSDSFMGDAVFRQSFSDLERDHRVDYMSADESQVLRPTTASERAIREYAGTPALIVERIGEVDVLVVHGAPVTDAVLDAAPDLRLVCCARGGPVNVDVNAATERGIPVVTTPGKNAEAVADLTLAFLIMLARGLPRAQRHLLEGGRLGGSTFEGAQFFGRELAGRSLGLVGYGHVGQAVSRRATALGMRLAVFDPFVATADADDPMAQPTRLEDLLAQSEFVSVHARASSENENLFDLERFESMRMGSCFINTARETLVDEDALDRVLSDGRLAGAALDVLRPAPAGRTHPLLRHPNVIVTPHIGGATHETLVRGALMLAAEIERFAAGELLMHVANPVVLA